MIVIPTRLEGVLVVEPRIFGDQRGFFLETYHRERYAASGIAAALVQDNISFSQKDTLRGLHFQHPQGQAKLVQVLEGEIFDVAVDIRHGSPTFGQWVGVTLSSKTHRQLFIPEGFAHGFCVLSPTALFMYKCSNFYAPQYEGGLRWNDPDLNIEWPVKQPLLSDRDSSLPFLNEVDADQLPRYED